MLAVTRAAYCRANPRWGHSTPSSSERLPTLVAPAIASPMACVDFSVCSRQWGGVGKVRTGRTAQEACGRWAMAHLYSTGAAASGSNHSR